MTLAEFLSELAAEPAIYVDYLKNRYGGGTQPGMAPEDWAALTSGDPRAIYQRLMGQTPTEPAAHENVPSKAYAAAQSVPGKDSSQQPIVVYLLPTTDQQGAGQTPGKGDAQAQASTRHFIFTHVATTPEGPRLVTAQSPPLVW